MPLINRDGRKKRDLRNLIRRGRVWYWKKMVHGAVKFISLETEDIELAKAKRNKKENEATKVQLAQIGGARSTAGTLAEVFERYTEVGGLTRKAIEGNKSMMLRVVRIGLNKETIEAVDVKLDQLTPKLARDYQDRLRSQYEAAAGVNEKERRMARDRADRTSRSTFNQAKSIFCAKRQLIERYRDAGIMVPECVEKFRITRAVGKATTKVYFPVSDEVLRETFLRIDELRDSECPELEECYYLFWAALGTGGRRNEVTDMRSTDLVDRNGALWIAAGLGKDGQQIQLPVINWPVHPANPTVPATVLRDLIERAKTDATEGTFLFAGSARERYDELGDRLNGWLSRLGWKDEKKLHALRAYIGCKLFAKNPRLAQIYLRHKSISTTEKFYSHFLRLTEVLNFEVEATPPTPALAVVQTSEQEAA